MQCKLAASSDAMLSCASAPRTATCRGREALRNHPGPLKIDDAFDSSTYDLLFPHQSGSTNANNLNILQSSSSKSPVRYENILTLILPNSLRACDGGRVQDLIERLEL